jgi:uncharacterized repeat protein (TIGR03847 family)
MNCIGEPGKRVFYIQARKDSQKVTLLCEKFQVQQLAAGIAQFIQEIERKFPDLQPASADYYVPNMLLEMPLESLFRVGQLGLGYDERNDLALLVAQAVSDEEETTPEPDTVSEVRFWATRSQLLAMGSYGIYVAAQGRPICGNCLQPIDSEGHFCPNRNGYKH